MENLDTEKATAHLPPERRTLSDDDAVSKAVNALRLVEAGWMPLAEAWPWVLLELAPILDRSAA